MHEMCRVLVNVEDPEEFNLDSFWEAGFEFLTDYVGEFFDYVRKVNAEENPDAVILGSKNPKMLLQTLQDIKTLQKLTATSAWKELEAKKVAEYLSAGIERIERGAVERGDRIIAADLIKYLRLVDGRFSDNVMFYDLDGMTALVDLDKVKAKPEEWALLLFDTHC